MSDGKPTIGCGGSDPLQDAINAAQTACESLDNLDIYTIGFGIDKESDDGIAAQANMEEIAAQCGKGYYTKADGADGLIGAYSDISETVAAQYKLLQSGSFLLFVFKDAQGNVIASERKYNLPFQLYVSERYPFSFTGIQNARRVEIYPGIVNSKGEDIIGNLIGSRDL